MAQCVLLNADYSFLNIVHWKRAVRLMVKDKVEVIRYSNRQICGVEGLAINVPSVMRLIKFIRTIYRARVPFSKKNVLVRDGFKCAYCGSRARHLTIDHVVPKSRGGATTFENCVASCRKCNNFKGNRMPSEVRMALKVKAYQPTISEFLRIKLMRLGVNKLLEEIVFSLPD
jgi:5-methylcytosine-specific restriction endonuclease McrA